MPDLYEAAGYTITADGKLAGCFAGNLVTGLFNLPAFFGIAMVSALLVVGVSESAKVNNVIVAIKVAVVLMFVGIGAFYVNPANWHPIHSRKYRPGPLWLGRHLPWRLHHLLRLCRV